MHAYRQGQGSARARVLYMFRSPSGVPMGRTSLDAEVREALEHTHPDLTFDWVGLLREPMPPPPRPDPRERGPRQRAARSERAAREARPPVVVEDGSLLGRTLGAIEATRLRARYAELNHRIARRGRTPEERDRLLEALAGTNPDTWTDETAVRAAQSKVDAQWDAITGELPRRRRGRRGGKDGKDQLPPSDVIIGERNESDERTTHAEVAVPEPAVAPPVTTVPESSGPDRSGDGRPAGDRDGQGAAAAPAGPADAEANVRQPS
ncbi:MAG: hypothetical protein HQ485_17065 [Acidobacteria bacterium]|nr:hypothetical protein [Acidobacteriota bacterium]